MRLPKVSEAEMDEVMRGKVLRLPYGDGGVLVVSEIAGKVSLRPLGKASKLEEPDTAGEGGSLPQLP